jgi:hypothetical protein
MRLFRHLAGGLACFFLLTAAGRADEPLKNAIKPDSPLRRVPAETDLLIEVRQPRQLVETITTLDTAKQLQEFTVVKELLDSTRARRFFQLLAYFEKELGAKWPELLDRLAGGGAAVGVKYGSNPPATLLVVQGTDEKLTAQFAKLALNVLEQELARQEVESRPVKGAYQGVETVSLGKEFHAAVVGSVILVSNNDKSLERALDLQLGREKKSIAENPNVHEAAGLLPPDLMASFWLNMEAIRDNPIAKEFYKTPRDPGLTVLFGGYLDVLGRTPFVTAGFKRESDGFLTTIRVPRGRDGMGSDLNLHLPPPGQPGTRPLLMPNGVLYSDSFYLDISRIWEDRVALFGEQAAKAMEQFDKDSGKIPFVKVQISKVLPLAGAYHRFVAVNQAKVGYKTTPRQAIPAFAFVTEVRKPDEFSRTVEPLLRGAALLTSGQTKLKLAEEKYKDCTIVGYRFDEEAPLKNDVNDLRFNFSPCFVRVGDQFVFSSTIELGRELVDLLQKEGAAPERGGPATSNYRFVSAGIADVLAGVEEQIVTQAILDQDIPPETARKEVKAFIALVRRLGSLTVDAGYTDKEFHYDLRTR